MIISVFARALLAFSPAEIGRFDEAIVIAVAHEDHAPRCPSACGRRHGNEWDAVTGQSQRSGNAERILGVVQGGGFLSQVHPADRRKFNALIRNLSPGNRSYALTFRFARADARDVWLEEEAKGEFDIRGKLLRVMV